MLISLLAGTGTLPLAITALAIAQVVSFLAFCRWAHKCSGNDDFIWDKATQAERAKWEARYTLPTPSEQTGGRA